MQQEFGFRRFFDKHDITPSRFVYEGVCQRPKRVIRLIARSVGVESSLDFERLQSTYTVVSTDKNLELAERFRKDEAEFVAYWTRMRGRKPGQELAKAE